MNRLLAIFFFLLSYGLTYGQKTITGKILNSTTHEPIPYANIGIVNSNVGTISNFDGSFSILLPERLKKDSLIFTSLGFFRQSMAVNLLDSKKEYTVLLNEKATILKPVIVTAKVKTKLVELGNKTFYAGNYEPDTTYAGRSVALLIETKDFPKQTSAPVYIQKANLYIYRNNFEIFKFRIRLNKYDSLTGKPGEDLIEKSIVVESSIKFGWLKFDLSKLNFQITKPFFITFEQLLDKDDRSQIAYGYRRIIRAHPDWLITEAVEYDGITQVLQKLTKGGSELPGTFIGTTDSKEAINKYSCFVRETSLGQWQKIPKIVAATISVTGLVKATNE